jgi:hypothetical protein
VSKAHLARAVLRVLRSLDASIAVGAAVCSGIRAHELADMLPQYERLRDAWRDGRLRDVRAAIGGIVAGGAA